MRSAPIAQDAPGLPAPPAVSIVICTRNRAPRLAAALRALASLRTQLPWEALVVDNASTDATPSVLAAADDCGGRLRVLRVATIGLGAARDAAWRQARGALVAFTDDDCYVAPDYVDALVAAFAAHPACGCIGGRILLHDPADAPVTIDGRTRAVLLPPRRFVPAGALQGANLAFRRATLEAIGGFDPALGAGTRFPCEDIDAVAATLWAGIAACFDPGPLVFHHHGRRPGPAVARLFVGYDRGRGAYYAKYLLRQDSRAATLRGWWRISLAGRYWGSVLRLARELRAAAAYLASRRRFGFLLLAAPVGLGALFVVTLRAAARFAWSRAARISD